MQKTSIIQRPRSTIQFVLILLAIGIASYLAIRFAYQVGFANNDIVAIWPAAALSYWAVRRFGPWAMLPIFLADAINISINLQHLIPIGYINGMANAVAPWLGVLLERVWSKVEQPFENVRSTLASLLAGMGVLSLVSASIGTVAIAVHYDIPLPATMALLWQWFLSDYTGCLVFAPLLFTLPQLRFPVHQRKQAVVDAILVLVSMVGVWLVTSSGLSERMGNYPTALLTMPAMLWLALREDTPRVVLGLAILSVGSFMFTIQVVDNLAAVAWLAVQLYIVVIIFCGYVLHALQLDRAQLLKTLARERDFLELRITERTKELELLATTDALTGALNRRSFFITAQKELKRARGVKPLSVILMDIDHFKIINDTFGHAVGDEVLVILVKIIQGVIRDGQDNMARLGGEEFAILLPETPVHFAMQAAERLRQAVEEISFQRPVLFNQEGVNFQQDVRITCSFGVAECDLRATDINQSLVRADNALFQAKRNGRNRVEADLSITTS